MRLVLPSIAVASLLAAMVLLAGCFVRMKLQVDTALKNCPHRDLGILLDGGRVGIRTFVSPMPSPNNWLDVRFDPPRFRMPDAKRLIWEFRFRTFAPINAAEIDFPSWIALLPCCIAPIAWIRRKRRDPGRGFAVMGRGG